MIPRAKRAEKLYLRAHAEAAISHVGEHEQMYRSYFIPLEAHFTDRKPRFWGGLEGLNFDNLSKKTQKDIFASN